MAYTTIDKPTDYFNTKLYTGNDGTQSVTGVGFKPDWVWIKTRAQSNNSTIFDVVRGVTKRLRSSQANAENTSSGVTSFNSDGFTVGSDSAGNSGTMVAWNWKAGTSFSNSAGANGADIASSGSVNTDAGFSIITATSNSGSDVKIAHGLGAVPDAIFAKNLDTGYSWDVYFKTLGYNASLQLNSTAAVRTGAWGSTTFTSTFFQTKNDYSSKNGSPYIYYCFAQKQGYSKFGSYIGNGSDTPNGVFVPLGFTPAYILIKATDSNSWVIVNNKSPDNSNAVDNSLAADSAAPETTGDSNTTFDFLSNGFKTNGNSGNNNSSGQKYVFMAFAESPFVTSTGIPATAR